MDHARWKVSRTIIFSDNRLAVIPYDKIIKELKRRYPNFEEASFDYELGRQIKIKKASDTWIEIEVPIYIKASENQPAPGIRDQINATAQVGFGDAGDGDAFGFTFNLIG